MRILSGIQPSGILHIGNYFGMIKPALELQEKGDTLLFIADYHALTVNPEPQLLRERVKNIALDFFAFGLSPDKTIFFRQSDVPEVTELTWILNTCTPKGMLERCHSYKDKIAKGLSPNNALFSYPVLMAADILIYKSNIVPVGKDQKQHVEVTRDIAIKFNNTYGKIFPLPEALIKEDVAIVPGIDGQKMSKSYNNTIEIFAEPKNIKKKVMSIVTDSKGLDEPKEPDKCNVFALYKLFATKEEIAEMRKNYLRGGYGYGHAKKALLEVMEKYFKPYREKRKELEKNPEFVEAALRQGAEKARAIAIKTIKEVRKAVGISG